MKTHPINVRELREWFDYDCETGSIIWKRRPRGVAIRDDAGCVNGRYRRICFKGVLYSAHRLAWSIYYGEDPGDCEIDHINHNSFDNRIKNLRLTDRRGQVRNRKLSKNNRSGYLGINLLKSGRWRATIGNTTGRKHLGYFSSKEDAIKARKAAEEKMGYHPNHGARITEAKYEH